MILCDMSRALPPMIQKSALRGIQMTERTTIDTRGAACTSALMELIGALRTLHIGDEVELLSADKGSAQEVADWCAEVRHECISVNDRSGYWSVLVRKAK